MHTAYLKTGAYKNVAVGSCLLLALCCRLVLQFHFFDFAGDDPLQAVAAQSLLTGKGISVPTVYARDLSTLVYTPLLAWPPGYSFLLLPVYWLTHNLVLSTLLVDFLASITFFAIYFLLLRKLQVPALWVCVLLLFNGLFLSQDVVSSTPTDVPALTALLAAVYYFITLAQRRAVSLASGAWLALLCFLPALFRYLYLPAALVLPLLLCLLGRLHKNRTQLKAGALALAGTVVFCMVLLLFLKSGTGITGNNPTLHTARFGFNVRHLHAVSPFLFLAFINLDFVAQQARNVTGASYQAVLQVINIFHLVVLFFTLAFLVLFIKKMRWTYVQKAVPLYVTASLLVSVFLIAALCFLSLTTALVTNPDTGTTWTYVQEERYYKFIAVFLPVAVLLYVKTPTAPFPKLKKMVQYGFVLLLLFEILHGFYFIGRRVMGTTSGQRQAAFENTYRPFLKPFVEAQVRAGKTVVFGGSINPLFWYVSGYAVMPLLNTDMLNEPLFAAKPTVLLVALPKTARPRFAAFLSKRGVKQEGQINNTYFFSLTLSGHD